MTALNTLNIPNERLGIIRSDSLAATTRGIAASVEINATLLAAIVDELLERRSQSMDTVAIYQCEFCHHDRHGELQWHWEDVNKAFYDRYDTVRCGKRRILYASPLLMPYVLPELVPDEVRDEIIDLCDGYEIGDVGAQEIWSACRSSLLNQSGKKNDKNA